MGVLTATQHKLTAEASVVASDVTWWGVSDIPPLEGRKFAHGASDCYTLVLDYYRLHRGVDIGDVPRDWTWHEDGQDYFDALFEDKGFVEVPLSEAREGDALLICYRGTMPQHCGILLGTDRILHHPGSSNPIDGRKLSVVEPIGRYTRYIKRVLRLTE